LPRPTALQTAIPTHQTNTYYRDPDKVQRWEGKFKTRSAAQDRLTEVLGEIKRGAYHSPSEV